MSQRIQQWCGCQKREQERPLGFEDKMDNYVMQQTEPWVLFPEIQQHPDFGTIPDNYDLSDQSRSSYVQWLSKLRAQSEYIYELSEDRPHYILPHEHVLKFVSPLNILTFLETYRGLRTLSACLIKWKDSMTFRRS